MIESEIRKNKWEEAVCPGFMDEIAGVMQAIDILLLPSL
jgi:hypothetical protein